MCENEVKAIESALKKVNGVYKVLITVILANIIVLIGVVWWASNIDSRVTHIEQDEVEIKKNMISPTDWKYNDYFTRYLWAERWQQTLPNPPYNTRGVAPNL